MVEKDVIINRVPLKFIEQPVLDMNQESRDNLTKKLHDSVKNELKEANFEVIDSKFRGKSIDSINSKVKMRIINDEEVPLWDLCAMRFIFKTNEEIDKVIEWFKEKYRPPEKYDFGLSWMRDFRSDRVKNEVNYAFMQPEYRAVHVRLPFEIDGVVDLMEVQLVTSKQEIINESTREAYERSRMYNEL
jgi:hypothetical protein